MGSIFPPLSNTRQNWTTLLKLHSQKNMLPFNSLSPCRDGARCGVFLQGGCEPWNSGCRRGEEWAMLRGPLLLSAPGGGGAGIEPGAQRRMGQFEETSYLLHLFLAGPLATLNRWNVWLINILESEIRRKKRKYRSIYHWVLLCIKEEHVERMLDDRTMKIMPKWVPCWKIPRSWPRKRWTDFVEEY